MHVHIISGWRYRPGMRKKTEHQIERMRGDAQGAYPLMPDAPGLIARLWATDPEDADTGVAVWVWESKDAADAFQYPWEGDGGVRKPLDSRMDLSSVTVQALDGMYLALAPHLLPFGVTAAPTDPLLP
jgi:hypothetical protein